MFFDDRPNLGPVKGIAGDPTSIGEVASLAIENAHKVSNQDSLTRMLEQEIDDRNDAIEKASGKRFENPFRATMKSEDFDAIQEYARSTDPFTDPAINPMLRIRNREFAQGYYLTRYGQQLRELQDQRPDLANVIRADETPVQAVAKKRADLKERFADVYDRGGWAAFPASLVGGIVGSFNSPPDVVANLVGLTISPSMSLVKTAVRSAIGNALVQSALTPGVALNANKLGEKYTWEDAMTDIFMAGAMGGALDVGFRCPSRAFKAMSKSGARADA